MSSNISKQKREKMMRFLSKLKEEHKDDDSMLIALAEIETELNSKKYGLVWEEHEEAVDVMMKDNIPVFTECANKEIHASDSDSYNFLLEGDNLHSLHLLEKTHKGKIDVIYIDPPYNTGSNDFIYDDNIIDNKDGFRHSKWLSFMGERLKKAQSLLSKKGCIFISIDDNEIAPLKLECDEIFGEQNFVAQLVWEKKKKGSFLSNQITNIKEYILVYCKDKLNFSGLIGEINTKTETYPCINAPNKRSICKIGKGIKSNYREKNYILPAGTIISDSTMNIKYLSDLVIENGIVTKDFEVEGNWRYSADAMYEYSKNDELYITNSLYIRRIVSEPRMKTMKDILPRVGGNEDLSYDDPINSNNLFDSGWGSNEDADNELIDFFGTQRVFSYPKPVRLVKKLICATRIDDAIILDFFAGSGTTAQAVLELNKEDDGNRKFILCTNNENGICENITYQRIKTVITGKREDGSDYSDGIPANLKYYRTDFVSQNEEYLSDTLLEHVAEMIQLEHGIKLDGKRYITVMNDDEADRLAEHWSEYPDVKALYVSKNVLFTTEQNALFKDVDIHIIPDYYFNFELREVGETW
jgi:adenine-specific DNA-methyltransferase